MNTLTLKKKEVSTSKIREKILDFEAYIKTLDGTVLGDSDVCPLKHSFSDGIYVREIFIPRKMIVVGKIHKHEHPNFLMSGKVTVITEGGGEETITGPRSMISKAGTKRVVYTHTDTVWITVHHNPDNTRDLKKLEEIVIAKNYLEYENFKKEISEAKTQKMLPMNCGLSALNKVSDLKKVSMSTLIGMAKDNGQEVYGYKVPIKDLKSVPFPAIFHSENHFDYVSSAKELNPKIKYSGNVLLTQKSDYTAIKTSELKNISGETWAAVVAGGVSLTTAGIGYAQKKNASLTACEKKCKTTCKDETKGLFGGRRKCIKECRSNCPKPVGTSADRQKKSGIGWTIAIIFIALAIGGLVYWAMKKK